jgi:hypothetical protein
LILSLVKRRTLSSTRTLLVFDVQCPEADEYINKHGLLRLLSYWNDKKMFEKRCAQGLKTFLDSGAYTAWTKNTNVDLDEYIKYVNKWNDGLDYFIQVDEIPGKKGYTPTPKERLASNQVTWNNYLYMRERVTNPDKLVPVFHAGSDVNILRRLLNYEPKIDMIAIGNIVGTTKAEKEAKLYVIFDEVSKSNNPDVKIHALGVQDFKLSEKFPLYSADASSWIMVSANGGIMSEYGPILVSEKSTEKKNHYENQSQPVKDKINEFIAKYGFTYYDLSREYKQRTLFNIKWLDERSSNYVCKYHLRKKKNTLF